MPALPVISNVFRTVLLWNQAHGLAPRNVLHFRGSPGTGAGLASALDTNFADAMWDLVQQDWAFTAVGITPLDGSTAEAIFPVTAQGSTTNGDWNWQVAAAVSIRTAQRGPRGRGRVYLGPVAESRVSSGIFSTGPATITAWNDFADAMAGDGYDLGVASYVHSDFHPATRIAMDLVPATQRRRADSVRG
jgi:hypothetical protein